MTLLILLFAIKLLARLSIFKNTHLTLKQASIPSFHENLVPKMKYIPNAMKFDTQSRLSSLIINMIFETVNLDRN